MSAIFSVDWSCCQMMFQHVFQLFKIFFSLKKIMTWLRKNIFSACLPVQHFSSTEEENSVGKTFWSGRLKFFAEKLMTSFQMLIFNLLNLSLILLNQYLKILKWKQELLCSQKRQMSTFMKHIKINSHFLLINQFHNQVFLERLIRR